MPTNDEIIKGDVPAYINDTLRLFYAELQRGETDYTGMLSRLAVIIDKQARAEQEKEDRIFYTQRVYVRDSLANILNEARADTAKQIFAKVESIKDEYGIPLLDTSYGKGEQYAKLKKQHKVPL